MLGWSAHESRLRIAEARSFVRADYWRFSEAIGIEILISAAFHRTSDRKTSVASSVSEVQVGKVARRSEKIVRVAVQERHGCS